MSYQSAPELDITFLGKADPGNIRLPLGGSGRNCFPAGANWIVLCWFFFLP
ncbi:unnamed protein product, partial [Staurois parvus]